MKKKIMYFKVYQDKDSINCGFYVDSKKNIENSLEHWLEEFEYSGEPFPVIEPVLMTEKEFKNLPEFEGF